MAHCLNGHTFFAQCPIWGGVWFPHATVWAAFVTWWLTTEQERPWVSAGSMETSLALWSILSGYPVTTALWGAHATWGRHMKASGQSLCWAQPASHSSPCDTWVKTPPDDPSSWPYESSKRKPQTLWSKDKTSLLCPEGSVSVTTCLWFHPLSLGAG